MPAERIPFLTSIARAIISGESGKLMLSAGIATNSEVGTCWLIVVLINMLFYFNKEVPLALSIRQHTSLLIRKEGAQPKMIWCVKLFLRQRELTFFETTSKSLKIISSIEYQIHFFGHYLYVQNLISNLPSPAHTSISPYIQPSIAISHQPHTPISHKASKCRRTQKGIEWNGMEYNDIVDMLDTLCNASARRWLGIN